MKKISYVVLILLQIGCASLDFNMDSIEIPIIMDSRKIENSEKFEVNETFWYWTSIQIHPNHNIQDLLMKEIAIRGDVKGIQNFQIIIYDNYHDSPQFALMNPPFFIAGYVSIGIMNILLFTKKSIKIKGEFLR